MNESKLSIINGKKLYYAFIAGGNRVLENQSEINKINVFPVNDKDTGTNLASTVRSVVDNISSDKSYKVTLNNIANASLLGARGNSGIIFAQFLYGLNNETPDKKRITIPEFIESVAKSIPYIYEAIANPVEGTMLTVIKEWADFLDCKKEDFADFSDLIINSLDVLEQSLKNTTEKLQALKKSGVVDAGAKGFVLFMEGIVDFVKTKNIRKFIGSSVKNVSLIHSNKITEQEITFRFCTEAIIKNSTKSKLEIQEFLNKNGDSVVVAGAKNLCRIHVHTNQPAMLFQQLKDIGTITFQKVDDMVRQQEVFTNRKWNIALVTDTTTIWIRLLCNLINFTIWWKQSQYFRRLHKSTNRLLPICICS